MAGAANNKDVQIVATPGNKRMLLRLGRAEEIQCKFAVIDDKMCGACATTWPFLPTRVHSARG
jgi:hypothetical protein